jgi:hypothetical protein
MNAADRIVAELGVGQPRGVAPHLLEEDVGTLLLLLLRRPLVANP